MFMGECEYTCIWSEIQRKAIDCQSLCCSTRPGGFPGVTGVLYKGCMVNNFSCWYCLFLLVPLTILTAGCDNPDSGGYSVSPSDSPIHNPSAQLSRYSLLLREPGITDPYYHKVEEVVIADDATVIGIEVDGSFRAFLEQGMGELDQHVVHTTYHGKAITIAYCDKSNCARAFVRGDLAVEKIVMGGMIENQLALMVNETRYLLNDEKIPLEEYPVTRTSWGEWKKDHPDTDIYIGIGMMFGPTVTDDARLPRTTSVGQD